MSALRCFLVSAGFGAGLLSLGSLALVASDGVTRGLEPLAFGFVVFVAAGALTVALLALTWRAAHPEEPDWRRGLVLLLLLLFAVFIWPTPYEHYRVGQSLVIIRVNRLTGGAVAIESAR